MKTREITLVALSVALMTICSYITLPIGPVPITMQTVGLFMIPMLFGPKIGVLSILSYILLGLMGVPVFAGGSGGLSKIFSPTFGFLLSYVPVAYFVGKNNDSKGFKMWIVYSLSTSLIYLVGAGYFYLYMNYYNNAPTDLMTVLNLAVLPFILGDILKIGIVEMVIRPIKNILDLKKLNLRS